MTLEEIIKNQKEHLTKAQIGELIQATERYKQLNSANRASAMRTLSDQYRATRRGLQNTGLAGRKGKIVSGQEKAARIRANEAYRQYNAGLRQIDNAYAQNRAARMANETAMANQLAETERIQAENDKEVARINAEYEAWLRKKKAAEDEYKRRLEEIERLRAQQQGEIAQQQQIRERIEEDRTEQSGVVQGGRIQRLAKDKHPQLETSDYARAAQEAVQKIQKIEGTVSAVAEKARIEGLRKFVSEYRASERDPIGRQKLAQARMEVAQYDYAANVGKWDAAIKADETNTARTVSGKITTRGDVKKIREDADAARHEKAKAESAILRADPSVVPQNIRELVNISDAEFAMRMFAARMAYQNAIKTRKEANADAGAGADTAYRLDKAVEDLKKATELFSLFERAKAIRTATSEETRYYDTFSAEDKYVPAKPSYSGRFGARQQKLYNEGWKATDYAKENNTYGSKYAPLVNDWSYGMGAAAQEFSGAYDFRFGMRDFGQGIAELFGGDKSYLHSVNWYVDECAKAFGNGTGAAEQEQMKSMLILSYYLNEDERARFNNLLVNYGADKADEYFDYLYNKVLLDRFDEKVKAEQQFATRDTLGRISASIESIPTNLVQGLNGVYHTLSTGQTDNIAARVGAMDYNSAQGIRSAVGSHYGEVGSFLYQTGMSMADSGTVALISGGIGKVLQGAGVAAKIASRAGSVLGGSLLGGSAFNSAYDEALQRGLAPDKARTVAVGQGINEMLFESLSLDLLVGQFQKGGILKVSKNGFVNWAVNTLVQGGVEGSEEVFTDIANRLWDNTVNGIYSEELTKLREYIGNGMSYEEAKRKVDKEFAEQLGMSFLGGAVSGGVMGGGATFMGMVQNRGNEKVGKGLRQNSRVMNELRNFDFKSEYAQDILTQDKLTNQDVADLFNIRQQELLGQYKSDIQQAVADGKITQEQADLLNKYEQNGVQIVKDGEVVANENGITAEQMPTVQDAIANLDNAARIQFLNNEEMRSLVQAVGGETAAVIEQSETAERDAEKAYRQTVREINNDTTLSPELKQKRLEAAERTRQNARSEASKIADTALTNKKGIGAKLETDGNGTVKVGKGSGKVTYDFSTKGNPGHQTVDSMTATEQSALRIAKIVAASRPDVNVKVEAEFGVDENGIDHSKENGYYDPNTKTIHINMSGDNSVLWTLSHELTHHLANTDTEAYTALRTAIETALKDSKLTTTELEDRGFEYDLDKVDPYIAREGNLWDALVAFEREERGYGKDAEEEVVARCCESFLGFDQFVKDFAHKQYKSAKAINKFIAQMNIDMQRVREDARQGAAQRNVWNDESPENQILRQLTEIDRIANLWRIAVNAEAKKNKVSGDTKNEDIRYSFRGRDALYSKPGSLDVQDLRDKQGKANLNIAYKMDREGIDSEKIRLATGWFKGYDGKWRSEIDDSEAKLADWLVLGKAINYMEEKARNAEGDLWDRISSLEDRLKKSNKVNGSDSEQSKALRKELRQTKKQREEVRDFSNRISTNRLKLSDILDHAKLYENYPQLKDVSVHLSYSDRTGGYLGSATGTTDITIVTDRNSKGEILETLMHEVQHIIQGIEGFAKGANVEYWADRNKRESADVKEAKATLAQVERELARVKYDGNPQASPLKSAESYAYITDLLRTDKPGTASYAYDTEQKEKYEQRAEEGGYADLLKKYLIAYQDVKVAEMEAKDYTKAFADYQRTAGEVEARDVASRLRMSEDERKATRPDIDRNDVTFFEDDVQHSFNIKLSDVDSPMVNRIADESFPIQPKTNRAEAEYEKTVAHDTKVRLADIQDSMFHPVMRSIKDAVPISERTLAKARSLKEIPYNISMYENTEKAIVELAKFIKENYSGKYDVQGNLLLPEETVQSNNIFSNASYLKDAEPTTECYRQTIYRAFLKVVTDQLGRPVTEREAIIVNQACIEIGLDAPCIYCYSLLDRKAKEGYKLQYLAERDAFLAKIDEEYHGDIEAFKRDRAKNFDRYNELYLSRVTDPAAYKDGVYDKSMARKGNAAKVDRVKLWLDVYESGYHDGTMITANDVRNIEAEEASLKEAKGNSLRTRELKDILYWSQSASQAKKIIPYSAYTNDGRRSILSWSQNTIDALNREYGLRWYSHADFHPAFIVDNMQQIMDASVKGLKGLMYVKPVEAAKIFAPTGMLINVSCFAQYKNGQYVADDRMGADWTEVQKLRKQYENVGAVMVVTTDDMWMWAMTQDWVDVIIPLHLVRSGSEFVDTFGLHNYSEEQADKLVGKAAKEKYEAFIADLAAQQEKALSDKEFNALKKANKSIYPGEHENDYSKYMEACEKRGLTPRFDRMRQLIEEGGMSWGGKEITLQDYMKCVSETRMPYTKAQTLKPSFDFDAAKQTAATLPEKGFFNYFKQSSEWNGKTMTMQDWVNQAVADINAKKDPSKLGYGRDLAVDESGKYLEIGTRAEAKRRGVGGIHDTRYSKMDDVRLSTDRATLAGQMHEGAKGARALREQSERYNERIDELNGRIGKLNKRIAELKTQIEDVSLAERMHQGAEDAAALRKVRNEYNERIAQRDRLLEQVRKQRDAAKQHAVEVRKQEREARARRDIVAVLKRDNDRIVKLLANPTENSHVPVQLAQAVAEYAQRLNELLTTSVPKSGEFAGMEKQTQKGQLNAQKIIDAYNRSFADEETIAAARAENPNYDPRGLIDPAQYDETLVKMMRVMGDIIENKHISDLTYDELQLVLNTMRGVIHTVQDANKTVIKGERKQTSKYADMMDRQLREAKNVFGRKGNVLTKAMNQYVIESLGLRRIAKIYSGSNEDAVFVGLVDDLNDGAIEKERIALALRKMFDPVTTKYAKDMKTWYGKNAEWIDTGLKKDGKPVLITKGMRVSLAMHILNEQNLRNLEEKGVTIPNREEYRKGEYSMAYKVGHGMTVRMTKAQAQQIVSQMTEAEKAYFDVAKELFHKRAGYYINRTSLQLLGYAKAIVENYFPIQVDDAYKLVEYDAIAKNAGVEHPGFLETRKGTTSVMYLNDITAVVNRQIDGVAKYAGLAIPMRNWNAVMNQRLYHEDADGNWVADKGRVHDTLENEMGYTATKYNTENGSQRMANVEFVDQFIKDLAGHTQLSANDKGIGGALATKLTSNYVKAVLLLNARVAFSQAASLPTAAAEIPWQYIAKAFKGHIEGHMNHARIDELIDQYTPIFAMRRAGTQNEIADLMRRRGLSERAEQKLPWLLGWITTMDTLTTRRLWYACEQWTAKETKIPIGSDAFYKEVAKRYERVIQNTQPNFTVLQRSPALRSQSPLTRIVTMFGTQRMQNGGIFLERAFEVAQAQGKEAKAKSMRRFGRSLSALVTAAIMLGLERTFVAMARGRVKPLQDDDDKVTVKSVDKYLRDDIISSLSGSFMFGSEIYDLVSGKLGNIFNGDAGYDSNYALPVTEALEAIVKFVKEEDWNFFNYMQGEHTDEERWNKTKSFVNKLMTVTSYLTGLPLQNASKTILNGIVPGWQDIADWKKTGEFNPWLHQSGKLDSAKTAANYKEWTNNGFKGSEYFYWENVLTAYGKREEKIPILLEADLPNEKKAMLLRMMDKSGATSEGTVVYKSNGDVLIDFANPTEKQQALPMPTAETEETATPTTTPTATPKPTENPLTDARQEGVREAVSKGVPEQTAFDAFLEYQNMGKNKSDDYSRNDDFRAWLFKNVQKPEERAILEYQVIGQASKVEGAVTYRDSGVVYRDYTNESWFKLSEHNLSKDGTNKRYEAGKRLEKTGLSVDKTVAIYDGLKELTKKAEWTDYLKKQGLTDEQINIFLWSRGWAK